ncbi:hypothetical protein [Microlunatus sp. GCM10028923]|uniref:hypothetical protein n=1 Tax=Microlunatus sp. GCM10028923 TaxID=3273400 RepID=UPI0036226900
MSSGTVGGRVRTRLTRSARGRLEPWRERGIRLLWALRINRPESQRPLPLVHVDVRHPVPGWALRLVGFALGAACLLLLWPAIPLLVLTSAALLLWLIRPGGVAVALYTALIGLGVLVQPDPWAPAGFVATAVVHLLVALSCLLGSAGWSARFEASTLRPLLLRWLVIQAAVQAFGLAGRWVGTLQLALPVLPLIAGAVLVGFAIWLFPRVAGRQDGPRR